MPEDGGGVRIMTPQVHRRETARTAVASAVSGTRKNGSMCSRLVTLTSWTSACNSALRSASVPVDRTFTTTRMAATWGTTGSTTMTPCSGTVASRARDTDTSIGSVARSFGRTIGTGVVAFVDTPVVITALFALVQSLPTWPTFVAVIGIAAGLGTFRRDFRGVAVGMACAAAIHAAALAWLFQSWSGLDRI